MAWHIAAMEASQPPPEAVFDRRAVRTHRDRVARRLGDHDFLFVDSARGLVDRLGDVNRRFPRVLDLGCHGGGFADALAAAGKDHGVETLVQSDVSAAMAAAAGSGRYRVVADEEALPFAAARFDLVVSALSLHWVNDLPGALVQIRRTLKPDGLFLAAMFGAGTLVELRHALVQAEVDEERGAGPRVSPFVEVAEAGALLQRAGFALPVADTDTVEATYADAPALMRELRGMGEANAMLARRKAFTRRQTMARAAALYVERFAAPGGRVRASFEILTLTGWAPDASQPQPLKPGSARTRLADALGTVEHRAGDKARPRRS